jgi:hypothetical protein
MILKIGGKEKEETFIDLAMTRRLDFDLLCLLG